MVALPHGEAERLLGDGARQDRVVGGIGRVGGAGGIEVGQVRGEDVAAAGKEGGAQFVDTLDQDRLVRHLVLPEEIRDVGFGRGAGLDADRGPVEVAHDPLAQLAGGSMNPWPS